MTENKNVVLFVGKIGSGKTTATEILKKIGYEEIAFADTIKQFAISLGFTKEQCYGSQEQKLQVNDFWGISGREFLQKFGTEVGRECIPLKIPKLNLQGKTIWVRNVERQILTKEKIVISDGRFPDEVEMVKEHNGIVIKLVREMKNGLESVHSSEKFIDELEVNFTINNNSTKDELEMRLLEILK